MKIKKSLVCLVATILLFGCATPPNKIAAQYISPLKYKDYDEDQIVLEMDHIGRRTNELYHSLKKKANTDKAQMGLGLILFWPALFALEGGDGPEATEYARLKGEYEALRTVAVQKKISLHALPPSPDQVIEQEDAKSRSSVAPRKRRY